jgi:DNA-binding CsgD family transcriptional regulator
MQRTSSLLPAGTSVFARLTSKQHEVLELVAENRTTKEIASALSVSESAINQRIDSLRRKFGGISRAELGRRFRASGDHPPALRSCEEMTGDFFHLAGPARARQEKDEADLEGRFVFNDAGYFPTPVPWENEPDKRVASGLLDGEHAGWFRVLAILAIVALLIASLVLVLTAAQVLTETYGEQRPGTIESQ